MIVRGLKANIELAKSRVYQTIGLQDLADDLQVEAIICAQSEGFSDCQSGMPMSNSLLGEPSLISAYEDGYSMAADMADSSGSLDEWHALTEEEQSLEWDNFHDLCAQGIADEMYFYRVLMDMHLVGYVGH